MALRGTLTHRKTRRLAKLLNIPIPCALGIVESLWHVTAEQAARGDIGRLSNQDIAEEMFWEDDADTLVEALIESRWIDRCDTHRLQIHDWPEHADQSVHTWLAKRTLTFLDGSWPRLSDASFSGQTKSRIIAEFEQKYGQEPEIVGQVSDSSQTESVKVLTVPVPEPVPNPDPETIPVGEIVSVETPLVNFDALDPFGIAESVLVGASQAIGGSPPTPEEVRRYCAKSSPVQLLAAKYGVRKSVAIAVYAMTVRTGIGWKGIWEGSMAFEKQMVDGVKSQFGNRKPEILDVLQVARQAAGVA